MELTAPELGLHRGPCDVFVEEDRVQHVPIPSNAWRLTQRYRPEPTLGMSLDDPDLLTDADVGRLYQIKPATLRSLRHRRQIPFFRLAGRIVRYRKADLEAWLASRAVGSRP